MATNSYSGIAQFVNVGTPSQNGTNGHPGRTVIIFWDTSLEIGTFPENLGQMVTLLVQHGMHCTKTLQTITKNLFKT